MLDRFIRPLIDPPLDAAARRLVRAGAQADGVTLFGMGLGFAGFVAVALGAYGTGLFFLLANRLCDGLDGAVARARASEGLPGGPTDFGGYLDIVGDFALWALLPLGFALADPAHSLGALVLLASFILSGTSFLAHAILAAKRGVETEARGRKSFFHLGGLTEGTETIAFFILVLLRPDLFGLLAPVFAALATLTGVFRVLEARAAFGQK